MPDIFRTIPPLFSPIKVLYTLFVADLVLQKRNICPYVAFSQHSSIFPNLQKNLFSPTENIDCHSTGSYSYFAAFSDFKRARLLFGTVIAFNLVRKNTTNFLFRKG